MQKAAHCLGRKLRGWEATCPGQRPPQAASTPSRGPSSGLGTADPSPSPLPARVWGGEYGILSHLVALVIKCILGTSSQDTQEIEETSPSSLFPSPFLSLLEQLSPKPISWGRARWASTCGGGALWPRAEVRAQKPAGGEGFHGKWAGGGWCLGGSESGERVHWSGEHLQAGEVKGVQAHAG